MAKIYLSSTFRDLAAHREAVYRTLRQMRHDVVSMEDYSAASKPPLDKCLQDVAGCDVYVGIFAWRYGYQPQGRSESITELEFRQAVASGCERLIFLLDEKARWPPELIDPDRDAIEALRAELQRDYVVEFFTSPEDLATAISVAVANLVSEGAVEDRPEADPASLRFYLRSLERMTGELASQIRLYRMSSVALVGLGLAVVAAGVVLEMMPFGVGGLLVGSATIFPVNTMLHTRRKKALLDGYQLELQQVPPAQEAVNAIRRFLRTQLRGEAFA